jgi:hypothetical protein
MEIGDNMASLKEALNKIREVGPTNTRITPVSGTKNVKIEVQANGAWVTVVTDVTRMMAEDILNQAVNRVILD